VRRSLTLFLASALLVLTSAAPSAQATPAETRTSATQTLDTALTVSYSAEGAATVGEPVRLASDGADLDDFSPRITGQTEAVKVVTQVGRPGTLRISFPHPVTDPVLHVAGLGGEAEPASDEVDSAAAPTPLRVALTAGSKIALTRVSGSVDVVGRSVTARYPDSGPASGSIRLGGAVSSVVFDVGARPVADDSRLPEGATEAFAVAVTTLSDSGTAPARYDGNSPARSAVGTLRLVVGDDVDGDFPDLVKGSAVTVNQVVELTGADSASRACGWLDSDLSGSFDRAERVCRAVRAGSESVVLPFESAPREAGTTYARIRLGYDDSVESPRGPAGVGDVEDYAISVVEGTPSLRLEQTLAPNVVSRVNQVVQYTFTATNEGDVTLSGVEISSDLDGLSALECSTPVAVLLPDDALTCIGTRRTTQRDLDFGSIFNAATAFGEAVGGDAADPTDDIGAVSDGTVAVVQRPRIRLTMAADRRVARPGDRVRLRLAVRNTGNVTVDHVAVTAGTRVPGLQCPPQASLSPGERLSCTAEYRVRSADAAAGRVVSRASVTAEKPYGEASTPTDDVVDSASVTVGVRAVSAPRPGVPTTVPAPLELIPARRHRRTMVPVGASPTPGERRSGSPPRGCSSLLPGHACCGQDAFGAAPESSRCRRRGSRAGGLRTEVGGADLRDELEQVRL
jgi:hypothetical protein